VHPRSGKGSRGLSSSLKRPLLLASALAALSAATPAVAGVEDTALPSPPGGEGAASASPVGDPPDRALVRRRLTLPARSFELELPVQVNLSRGEAGQPWSIPASIDYGATEDLRVGLYHEVGLCFGSVQDGCRKVYDDVGGRARLGVYRDPSSQLVVQAGLLARRFDDLDLSGSVGAAYKRTMRSFAVVAQLDLAIALTRRDHRLYDELLVTSVEGEWQASDALAVFALVGAAKALQVLSPYRVATAIPVAVGLELEPARQVDVVAELSFPDLLGVHGSGGDRTGSLAVRLRF
jgi:hypothetical protein